MNENNVIDMTVEQIHEVLLSAQGVGSDYSPNSIYVVNTTKITNIPGEEDVKLFILDDYTGQQAVVSIVIDNKYTIVDLLFNDSSAESITVNQRFNKYLDYVNQQQDDETYSMMVTIIPKKYGGSVNICLFNPIFFGLIKDSGLSKNKEIFRMVYENESIEVYGNGES